MEAYKFELLIWTAGSWKTLTDSLAVNGKICASGKDETAEREGWAQHFVCYAEDTMDL